MAKTNERLPISIISQLVTDLYYQDYPGRDAFIGEEQIMPLIGMAYARMLNEDYRANKAFNKAQTGYSWVEVSQDWLEVEDVPVTVDKQGMPVAILSKRVFAFDYDSLASGVQIVSPSDPVADNHLVRVGQNDVWKNRHIPKTSAIFFYVKGNEIKFISNSPVPKSIHVEYVPAVWPISPEDTVDINRSEELVKETLQMLLIAKNGVVVDKTDNSNPNVLPQTEIDAASFNK